MADIKLLKLDSGILKELVSSDTPKIPGDLYTDGKLGSGIAPAYPLHIKKDQASSTFGRIENLNAGGSSVLWIKSDTPELLLQAIGSGIGGDLANYSRVLNNLGNGLIIQSKATSGGIQFWVGDTDTRTSGEKMRIDSLGRVGINKTAPVGLLYLDGTSGITGADPVLTCRRVSDGLCAYFGCTSYDQAIKFQAGVNTNLNFYCDNADAGGRAILGFFKGSGGVWKGGIIFEGSYTAPNDRIQISTSTVEAITILQSGLIGFGITNPTERVHIYGNLKINTPSHGGIKIISPVSAELLIDCDSISYGYPANVVFNRNGVFKGLLSMEGLNSSPTDRIHLNTATVEAITILQNGNVGINVSNPGYKFHVNGNLWAGANLLDTNAVDGETGLMVWRWKSPADGQTVRVCFGDANSGGAGYRVLRIPN